MQQRADNISQQKSSLSIDEILSYPSLIIYDGECNLCNSSVRFIEKKLKQKNFRYIWLQSDKGKLIKEKLNINPEIDSFIFKEGDQVHQRSEAVLQVCKYLIIPWRWLGIFLLVPLFLRDFIYKLISKSRYRILGKKASCELPNGILRTKIIQ